MIKRVLITGGAGLIGSQISTLLLERGYEILVLDSLRRQVHSKGSRPDYLPIDVELVEGDIRDRSAVRDAVAGAEAVIHLAAAVGVGQSMYEMASYAAINDVGTAVLLEEISRSDIQRLITASSKTHLWREPGQASQWTNRRARGSFSPKSSGALLGIHR